MFVPVLLYLIVLYAGDMAAASEQPAITLIITHGPDGSEVALNISEISSLRQVLEERSPEVAPGVHCVIAMTNAKTIGVREHCLDVIRKLSNSTKVDDN